MPKKQIFFIPLYVSNRHWTLSFVNLETKTLYLLDPLTQHTNGDLANEASSQILFLRTNLVTQKDLQLEVFKKCFKIGLSKRKWILFQMIFFEEFCKVIMLNFRMSDAISLHLIFICLPYALFPVQSNSIYLLVFAEQS